MNRLRITAALLAVMALGGIALAQDAPEASALGTVRSTTSTTLPAATQAVAVASDWTPADEDWATATLPGDKLRGDTTIRYTPKSRNGVAYVTISWEAKRTEWEAKRIESGIKAPTVSEVNEKMSQPGKKGYLAAISAERMPCYQVRCSSPAIIHNPNKPKESVGSPIRATLEIIDDGNAPSVAWRGTRANSFYLSSYERGKNHIALRFRGIALPADARQVEALAKLTPEQRAAMPCQVSVMDYAVPKVPYPKNPTYTDMMGTVTTMAGGGGVAPPYLSCTIGVDTTGWWK